MPFAPAVGGGFSQIQRPSPQQIQTFYQEALQYVEDAKKAKAKESILIGSVFLYACQIANQAINIKQSKNPKQLGQLYINFFTALNDDLKDLPQKQPAAQQAQQTTP